MAGYVLGRPLIKILLRYKLLILTTALIKDQTLLTKLREFLITIVV